MPSHLTCAVLALADSFQHSQILSSQWDRCMGKMPQSPVPPTTLADVPVTFAPLFILG